MYATLYQRWNRAHGKFPTPIWVCQANPDRNRGKTDADRLEEICALWQRAWPGGGWLLVTPAGLRDDVWHEYRQGARRVRTLLEG